MVQPISKSSIEISVRKKKINKHLQYAASLPSAWQLIQITISSKLQQTETLHPPQNKS
jgi:hypothetical protein